MASSKEYLDFILDTCGELSFRAMMGEYLLYYKGRLVGGIYDNRLLVKPVNAAKRLLQGASEELPYDGAKPMLLVENIEDGEFLSVLFEAMHAELPAPKKKKG